MNKQVFSSKHSRRLFIKYSSFALGTAALTGPYLVRGQNLNSKLNIATIGAGGKGASDTDHCSGENIVALCDVDQNTLDGRMKKYTTAKGFRDYRKMLEEMQRGIDAVIVATPDHHHAPASVMAMKMGKHVYCQKPLTHSVNEARVMRRVAKEQKVITQMGNQGSSESGLRRAVEVIQGGVIGAVRQVHVWSNRPIWPQGIDRPSKVDPVPKNLDWDLWLGPAPERPYVEGVYHSFAWRGWLDFGTGALGDMACHTANMPFRALKLGYPKSIEAESSAMNKETYPLKSKIRFEFPAREGMPPLSFFPSGGTTAAIRATVADAAVMMATTNRPRISPPTSKKCWARCRAADASSSATRENFSLPMITALGSLSGITTRRNTSMATNTKRSKRLLRHCRATRSLRMGIAAIISNGSKRSRKVSNPTRTLTSRLTSRKSSFSASSLCARARDWTGMVRI
jgi:hypothetical protein